jgi:hypothetical protein
VLIAAENRDASAKRERIFGGYGASRTRTGDLLGAICSKGFAMSFRLSPLAQPREGRGQPFRRRYATVFRLNLTTF